LKKKSWTIQQETPGENLTSSTNYVLSGTTETLKPDGSNEKNTTGTARTAEKLLRLMLNGICKFK